MSGALFDDSAVTEADLGARPDQASRAFDLVVTEGASAGTRISVGPESPVVLVGGSTSCALRLEDRTVSRRHVSFEHAGARLRVSDLRSTNGTFVDGVAIEAAFVAGGETVRIGSSAILVEPRDVAPAASDARASFGSTVGASLTMQRAYRLAERLAASDVPVVIEGETGTGKEALAESLHAESRRAGGPFVVLDCTAIPASLFEAELLGHERGAFTGANGLRKGVFELADGGTLLIDEIGDLDLALQAKLLRVVETASVRRLGGDRAIKVDVRILAATRRDLDREVQEGRFRDDLFHRLAVARLELPPLRRRTGDITRLALHFWRELGGDRSGPGGELLRRWEDHEWPGNVRELRNTVARQIALGDLAAPPTSTRSPAAVAEGDGLDALVRASVASRLPLTEARDRVVRAFEQAFLEGVAAVHGNDPDRIAAAAGIGRRYLNMIRARARR